MRSMMGILMLMHGLAHSVGMIVSWQLAPLEGAIYRTTILMNRWDVGDAGMRVMGALWLIATLAFAVAAVAAFTTQSWWVPMAVGASLFSLVMSVLALPDSRIGVAVNLLILGLLAMGIRSGWLH